MSPVTNTEFQEMMVSGSRPWMRPSVVKLESILGFSVKTKALSGCDRQLGDAEESVGVSWELEDWSSVQ